ncbi:hypothetical protein BH09ACT12_BH09ACT12_33750 [soil metagenome]
MKPTTVSMRTRGRRRGRTVAALAVAIPVLALTACGTTAQDAPIADSPQVQDGELEAAAGATVLADSSLRGLPDLQDALAGHALYDPSAGCDGDLGPRWLVVYSHDGDLTGVLVDDFGCDVVRLTDDPRSTPPGEVDENGMVVGVLAGGPAILDALGVGRSS